MYAFSGHSELHCLCSARSTSHFTIILSLFQSSAWCRGDVCSVGGACWTATPPPLAVLGISEPRKADGGHLTALLHPQGQIQWRRSTTPQDSCKNIYIDIVIVILLVVYCRWELWRWLNWRRSSLIKVSPSLLSLWVHVLCIKATTDLYHTK